MRKLALAITLSVALTGCDGARLSELTRAELSLNKASVMERRPETGSLEVVLDVATEGDSCPTLSSRTHATLNELPLTTLSLGEEVSSNFSGFCRSPSFALRTTPAEVVRLLSAASLTLKVMDGESTRVVEVGALCGPRRMRMVRPADGLLRVGETVELEWEPATDRLKFFGVSISEVGGIGGAGAAAQVQRNRLSFIAPRWPGQTERALLNPSSSFSNLGPDFYVPVTRCDFDRCDMECGLPVPFEPLEVRWAP
jgi:hypothetical protein